MDKDRRRAVVIAAAAFIIFCMSLLAISISALIGQSAAQSDARKANDVAKAATDSNNALRAIIVQRCNQRLAYDSRFIEVTKDDIASAKDDIATYETSIKNAEAILSNPVFANNPGLLKAEKEAIRIAKDAVVRKKAAVTKKQKIVAEGVIGNCKVYTDPSPTPLP